MDDLDDPETAQLLRHLQTRQERRKGMVASHEDIGGTHESLDGLWSEWMCPECGIFMREHLQRCRRCGVSRDG